MSKKNIILSLLLCVYTLVLGHNIIPHGHFDEIFSTVHHHDNDAPHNSHHDSKNDHNFPFSHSATLHITLDKQNVYSYQLAKVPVKNISLTAVYTANKAIPSLKLLYNKAIEFQDFIFRPQKILDSSLYNRPPPLS